MENNDDFLGRGWGFPPAFAAGGADVLMVEAERDIEESIRIILGTRPMERTMREEFGCDVKMFLFEAMSQHVLTGIRQEITDALTYYEPRIEPEQITLDDSGRNDGVLFISIQYKIRSTNTRYNMVYPFYLNEATDI